jgi:hypothetical protein
VGKAVKKDVKSLMKGVVVKKKPKADPVKAPKADNSVPALPRSTQPPQSPPSALKAPKRPVEPEGESSDKKQKL